MELSPDEVIASARECIEEVVKKASENSSFRADVRCYCGNCVRCSNWLQCIESIGIANQRESCVAWRRSTGEALDNVIRKLLRSRIAELERTGTLTSGQCGMM